MRVWQIIQYQNLFIYSILILMELKFIGYKSPSEWKYILFINSKNSNNLI
jgi:hypothetical protein